ncbi:CoA-acylating methylmalonate-semialdehyde dehydrogenase [Halobacterium salinarum]|uniref:CoA-acylating methylmalonate-semialdehyde dehydrogenase n=1 Tax=Halobacterium salinarum TaxID=2242 RepID=UPI0025534CAC|nr:CoA-acylating methylmalonate-semialdehyde dehydrogenase [Halobacterium salinarum]MDL0135074.1 CoA-acylating methylmalonate-semialdehyde dehydrogenase [Halobacterium salinarum]MDL0135366.1 CoA-acylating methylmalonate-semialdehyde dehydrogenase [Halobacterium salinarum]MDL0138550.1 CoA-acylating methylmalonate-semialdehyde dehydrogenase [Halobacterium salinarum]
MSSHTDLQHGTVNNYINGGWTTPKTDGQNVNNPATNTPIAHVNYSSETDVNQAVTAAQAAFEEWHQRPVEERIQPLFEFKQLLEEHQDDLAEILVEEHGKTFGEAKGELRRGIENVETACGIPTLMQAGHVENAAPGIDETAVRKPLGVFAAVTPFNFPGMIPLWFLPYAVATGNAFILKPSEQTPLTAEYLFDLLDQTSFPDGVVQLVHGSVDTVNTILEHDGIEGVSFVGSTPVAKTIYEKAAANGKRVQAQGGAKNHVIVTESANLEFAAEKTVGSALACSGERCLANDVVVVEESVYEEFVDLIEAEVERQVVGNGLDDDTTIGALISPEHEQRVRNHVETGVQEGADLIYDGRDIEVEGYEDGNFLGPCVFRDITDDMVIAREEIFGPVFGLMPASGINEAIDVMNRSEFGNAASLFTGSGAEAKQFRHNAEAGNLAVNAGTAAPMAFFHFGGQKDSFFGDLHAQAEDVVRFYTDETVYIERWPDE